MKRRSGKVSPGYPDDDTGSPGDSPVQPYPDDGVHTVLPGLPYPGSHSSLENDDHMRRRRMFQRSGSLHYSPGTSRRNKDRLPSTRSITGNLPECQLRHERIFSKPLVEMKRQQLLSSSKRSKLNQAHKQVSGHQAWKAKQKLSWARCRIRCREATYRIELWRRPIKTIEGHYGSGIVSYFQFLRSLFLLNLWIFLLMAIFVVVPQIAFDSEGYDHWFPVTMRQDRLNQSDYCSSRYNVTVDTGDIPNLLLDFLQGTGWMEKTLLYYGYYTESRLAIGTWGGVTYFYSLPLAYFLVPICIFGLSLFLMVKQTAGSFRTRIIESDSSSNKYSTIVFAGWDFALNATRCRKLKHKNLYNEIITDLQEDRDKNRRESRRCRDNCRLFTIRLCINIFVVIVLGACGYGIYYATQESLKFKEKPNYDSINNFVQLLMEYLPSITITVLNVIIPVLFITIAKGEDLSPVTEIQITLGRIVFLRLASLAVLLGTIYTQITCSQKDPVCDVGILPKCPPFKCWETYVGQQIYKLIILDVFVVFGKVFLVDFPRRIIATKCECKLAKMIGKPQFELPMEVLALVYSQILCWLGVFFSPLIPAICVVNSWLVFYLKKLTCIHNCVPPSRQFRASRSQVFFMGVLIAAFVMCCVPVVYIIWRVSPSKSCGPFRIYDNAYDIMTLAIMSLPTVVQQIYTFLSSAAFVLPGFVTLIVVIYYCAAIANARKEMVAVIRDQLLMERKDKKFLLMRMKNSRRMTSLPGYHAAARGNTRYPGSPGHDGGSAERVYGDGYIWNDEGDNSDDDNNSWTSQDQFP